MGCLFERKLGVFYTNLYLENEVRVEAKMRRLRPKRSKSRKRGDHDEPKQQILQPV
jgi:hypothetical protein